MITQSRLTLALVAVILSALTVFAAGAVGAAGLHRVHPAHKSRARGVSSRPRTVSVAALTDSPGTPVFAGSALDAHVVARASYRCLTLGTRHAQGQACGTRAEINEGSIIAVTDECGSSGSNRMNIAGLAPEGTETVRLRYSDGSSEETPVEDGAFLFAGSNPTPGAPYPDGVRWLGAGGADLGAAELPVVGDQFCIEPPEPPAAP